AAGTDRPGHRGRLHPDHGVDAAVLAGDVRGVPAGDLRRTGVPGLGGGAAVRCRPARRRALLVVAGAVAARRLALAGGVPEPGPVGAGVRLDPGTGAADLLVAAAGRSHR